MPVGGACSYCLTRRAVNHDHVIPRMVWRRAFGYAKRWRKLGAKPHTAPFAIDTTVPSCFECNMRKGTRLLIPPSWADRLDELNALGIGTFRVWHGDAESLREVVK